jgi:hypothetical protein
MRGSVREDAACRSIVTIVTTGRYSFQTFEEYCEHRWELDLRYANRLIEAATLVEKIGPTGLILPAAERHVRPLLDRLDRDDERLAGQICRRDELNEITPPLPVAPA